MSFNSHTAKVNIKSPPRPTCFTWVKVERLRVEDVQVEGLRVEVEKLLVT